MHFYRDRLGFSHPWRKHNAKSPVTPFSSVSRFQQILCQKNFDIRPQNENVLEIDSTRRGKFACKSQRKLTRGNFRNRRMKHFRRKCSDERQNRMKLIVLPVTTRLFVILKMETSVNDLKVQDGWRIKNVGVNHMSKRSVWPNTLWIMSFFNKASHSFNRIDRKILLYISENRRLSVCLSVCSLAQECWSSVLGGKRGDGEGGCSCATCLVTQ